MGNDEAFMLGTITDVHSLTTDKYKHVGYLSKLSEVFHFDLLVNCGDIGYDAIDGATVENKLDVIYNTKNCMTGDTPWLFVKGNHDVSYEGESAIITESKLMTLFNNDLAEKTGRTDDNPAYGYVDYAQQKIRVIYINTSDNISWAGYTMKKTQMNWFVNALESVQSGWRVVVISHLLPHEIGKWNSGGNEIYSDAFTAVREILESFANKTSGSKYIDNTGAGGTKYTQSWDFSSVDAKLICVFSGDSHFNNYTRDGGVNYVVRQGYGFVSTLDMPTGSTRRNFNFNDECCFDILAIKDNGTAKVFRVGEHYADDQLSGEKKEFDLDFDY